MKAKSWSFRTRVLAVALIVAVPAWAESASESKPSAEPAPVLRGMEERVSLDFKSTDVVDALKYLAQKGGLNIAISKSVGGRVNLSLTDVPIRDVFDIILRANELAYDKQGNVYHIMSEAEYRALYGRRFTDLREIKTFRLQYAMPEPAFNMLDALKSEIGRLLVDEDSGTVLVMDTPENLRRMEESLATLERGGALRVFDLRYAKAKDVEERLKDQIDLKKLGFVKADERSNQIIVKTLPERMRDVEQLIAALDVKTREVLINAKIIKVSLTNNLDAGIDWDAVFTNLKFHGIDQVGDYRSLATTTAAALAKIPIGQQKGNSVGKLAVGSVSETGYEVLRYLERIGQTRVISTPRILVTNNQEAKIHVGTREAYVTTTTTTGQTTSTTAEEVQFVDVGIQLSVTPTINADGYVTMKIKPEISSVIRTLVTPSRNQIPIVDTSVAETNVMVKDGETVVIGGLAKDQKQSTKGEIPILAKIPLFGEAFRRRERDDERTELVVLITPHVVGGETLVTGDEPEFGGHIKPFRDYHPIFEGRPSPLLPEPRVAPTRPLAEAEPPSAHLRLREQLRGRLGTD